ncbi:MAG: alpha/beta fold hydrolase [Candidatus Nanopelagicales bacterium]|nr:alpha/beta fold hydrolase [Candidatus Nanopelagicales bacterium]MCF8538080.1 alpha/beta fold hydrolase [Candidatus Nanopelagicales bacterium]MCF8543605.1 alpha/beta fold hydrolase [Candidatus Nanopelagicales bacterium]MCF8557174.1 alpha/beta fold hydrolase [Candidatus Nanopelagicales bacterium]
MTLMPGAEPWRQNGGPVGVLVLHGFTGSPKSVTPWGRALAEQGWAVSVPLLPGHGTRWQDMNQTTWQDWYHEAERALRDLRSTCDTVFVMGLSMGGSLALKLAEEHGDDIRGLALVNPAVHTERPDRFLLPILHHIIGGFPGISNDIAKPGQDEGAYDRIPLKAAHSLSQMWRDVKADLPRISTPLLLFRSAEDHVVEPSNAAWILDHVSSDDVAEVVLPDSYHVATLDYDAEIIVRDSIDFVRRLTS